MFQGSVLSRQGVVTDTHDGKSNGKSSNDERRGSSTGEVRTKLSTIRRAHLVWDIERQNNCVKLTVKRAFYPRKPQEEWYVSVDIWQTLVSVYVGVVLLMTRRDEKWCSHLNENGLYYNFTARRDKWRLLECGVLWLSIRTVEHIPSTIRKLGTIRGCVDAVSSSLSRYCVP